MWKDLCWPNHSFTILWSISSVKAVVGAFYKEKVWVRAFSTPGSVKFREVPSTAVCSNQQFNWTPQQFSKFLCVKMCTDGLSLSEHSRTLILCSVDLFAQVAAWHFVWIFSRSSTGNSSVLLTFDFKRICHELQWIAIALDCVIIVNLYIALYLWSVNLPVLPQKSIKIFCIHYFNYYCHPLVLINKCLFVQTQIKSHRLNVHKIW